MKNPNRLNENNLNVLVETLKSHNITIECENPETFHKFSEALSKKYFFNYLSDLLKRNVFGILFEIDTNSKKILSCGSYIFSQYASIYPEYSRFIKQNLNVLRYLLRSFSVLDIDGVCLVSWKHEKQFLDENLEGFSYFLPYIPAGEGYNQNFLNQEDLRHFYTTCGINSRISNYFIEKSSEDNCVDFYPHYATFSVEHELPIKYGFCSFVGGKMYNFVTTFYQDYEDVDILLDWMKYYFDESFFTIQLSTLDYEEISFEVGMTRKKYIEIIDGIISNDKFLKLFGDNIKNFIMPEFVETIVFKFKWENKSKKQFKVYLETGDEKYITQILGIDTF